MRALLYILPLVLCTGCVAVTLGGSSDYMEDSDQIRTESEIDPKTGEIIKYTYDGDGQVRRYNVNTGESERGRIGKSHINIHTGEIIRYDDWGGGTIRRYNVNTGESETIDSY